MFIQGVKYASDFEAKKQMIETGKNLDDKGYTVAGDGSMSVRVGPNAVWITKGDSENGSLSQESFIRVDMNGKAMNRSPDVIMPDDLEIHLKIYRENAKIQAVIHAYPACAAALQGCSQGLDACGYTPAARALGRLTLIPSGDTGQITAAAALAAGKDKGVLLESDGCLMWGAAVREAYNNLRVFEYCAKVKCMTCGCAGRTCGSHAGCGGCQGRATSAGTDPGAAAVFGRPAARSLITPPVNLSGTVPSRYEPDGLKTSSPAIPGLTEIYRPKACTAPASGVYRPEASVLQKYTMGTAGKPQLTGQTTAEGLMGTTRSAQGFGINSVSAAGVPKPASGNSGPSEISGLTGVYSQDMTGRIQTAPSDPVKDKTVSEVVKRSMKMLGKGGL